MTYAKYYDLIRDALEYSSAEQFIGAVGYPEWAPDDANKFVDDLQNIWDVAHMSVKDMRARVNMSQRQLSDRFAIPKSTVQNWDQLQRECPQHTRLMMADLLGLITVSRE